MISPPVSRLVTCPVALYPATSDSEKISFNQVNKRRPPHQVPEGRRRHRRRGSQRGDRQRVTLDKDQFIEVSKEKLEEIALERRRSVGGEGSPKESSKKPRKAAAGQKEMLMPIAVKRRSRRPGRSGSRPRERSEWQFVP
jgi:hypothetical protein